MLVHRTLHVGQVVVASLRQAVEHLDDVLGIAPRGTGASVVEELLLARREVEAAEAVDDGAGFGGVGRSGTWHDASPFPGRADDRPPE